MHALNTYTQFLGLTLPVELRVRQQFHKKADAYYRPQYSLKGKLKGHRIDIYTVDACRDFNTLLAHELIHAWCEEKGFTKRVHGKRFQCMAQQMQARFINLKELYISGVDVD